MSERDGYVPPEAVQKKPEYDSQNDHHPSFGEDSSKHRERRNYTPYGSNSLERPGTSPEIGPSGDVRIPQQSGQGDTSSSNTQNDSTVSNGQNDNSAGQQVQQQHQDQSQQEPTDRRDDLSHLSPEDREKYNETLAKVKDIAREQSINHTLRPGE